MHRHANRLALETGTRHARRLGLQRREFLVSAWGAATTLLGMNAAYAAAGQRGGYYDLPEEAALDGAVAQALLHKNEFIFDVQGHGVEGHFVNPSGAWTRALPHLMRDPDSAAHALGKLIQACGPTPLRGAVKTRATNPTPTS